MLVKMSHADPQGGNKPAQKHYIWHQYQLGDDDILSSEFKNVDHWMVQTTHCDQTTLMRPPVATPAAVLKCEYVLVARWVAHPKIIFANVRERREWIRRNRTCALEFINRYMSRFRAFSHGRNTVHQSWLNDTNPFYSYLSLLTSD